MIFRLDFHLPVWLMYITLLMCCSSVFPQLRFTYPTCNCTSKCYLVLACHLQRFGKVVLFEHFPGVFRGRDVCIEYQFMYRHFLLWLSCMDCIIKVLDILCMFLLLSAVAVEFSSSADLPSKYNFGIFQLFYFYAIRFSIYSLVM